MPGLLSKERIIAPPQFNRWRVPPASVAIHLCIGSVYAWSIFNPALTRELGVVASAAGDWSLGSVVVPTLRQEGRPVHVDDAERGLMGGVGSFEIWRFRAEQPGRVALTFQYRRPWESTGTPTRSLNYEVVVR